MHALNKAPHISNFKILMLRSTLLLSMERQKA